jgi:hypothetical protein
MTVSKDASGKGAFSASPTTSTRSTGTKSDVFGGVGNYDAAIFCASRTKVDGLARDVLSEMGNYCGGIFKIFHALGII